MKKYYISSWSIHSGILEYSQDFYLLVLKEKGYDFIDSNENITNILSTISSKDLVHLEISTLNLKELEILYRMLKSEYKNVCITLHDYHSSFSPGKTICKNIIQAIAKFYEPNKLGFNAILPYVDKIKTIYVISRMTDRYLKHQLKLDNVRYLPPVVDLPKATTINAKSNNLLYVYQPGQGKELETLLKTHKLLLENFPECRFLIATWSNNINDRFFFHILETYTINVSHHRITNSHEFDALLESATFGLVLCNKKNSTGYIKLKILEFYKKGKIVILCGVKTTEENLVKDQTVFNLTGDVQKDRATLRYLFNNQQLLETVNKNVLEYLITNHSAEIVKSHLI